MPANRSPNYPAVSLPDAIELIAKLYQQEKRSPADSEQAAHALGYNSMSGPARTKLSALRKYELVEDTANGVRISDLGMTILYPRSPEEKAEALRVAATSPALFREMASFPGASDGNLVSRLVRTGFTEAGAKLAVASYRKTMSLVPDEESEYSDADESATDAVNAAFGIPSVERPRSSAAASASTKSLSIPLPGELQAELRWSGGPMTKRALDHLRKYLDLYEETISLPEAAEAPAAIPPLDLGSTEPEPLALQSGTAQPE